MTTVYESIAVWLTEIFNERSNGFPTGITVIDLEAIPAQTEFPGMNLSGIFSSPNDIHTPLIGGQEKHTEFKSFYFRRNFMTTQTRMANEAFFDLLRNVIRKYNLDYIMPKDGRDWISITINGGIYPAQRQENNAFADYLIPLRLEYQQ